MRGVVLCAVLVLLGLTSVAHAGRYKVTIESEPAGATVYFESTETSPICAKTPCTFDGPASETTVYIQLENYTPEIVSIDPAKKTQKIKVTLKAAVGAIVIEGAKGARVTINEEDKGKAPDKFELPEGAYHVVVTGKDGKVLYDEFVEVKAGEDVNVQPMGGGAETPDPEKPDDETGAVVKPGPTKARDRYVQGSVVMDIGFRSFTYDNNQTESTLLDESEGGQVLLGPMIEIWPTEILGLGKLRGLSLMGRIGFNVNPQSVTQKGASTGLTTFWQAIEVLVRHRWNFGKVGLEINGGYGRDAYQFSGDPGQIALVPDAVYDSVRIGARVVGNLGKIEPYAAIENRIVLSGGAIEDRFARGADVSGLHAAAGAAARFGAFGARLEGAITRYAWTFTSMASDMRVASGGTDVISQLSLAINYAY